MRRGEGESEQGILAEKLRGTGCRRDEGRDAGFVQ